MLLAFYNRIFGTRFFACVGWENPVTFPPTIFYNFRIPLSGRSCDNYAHVHLDVLLAEEHGVECIRGRTTGRGHAEHFLVGGRVWDPRIRRTICRRSSSNVGVASERQ